MNHGRIMLLSVIFGGLVGCAPVDYPYDTDHIVDNNQPMSDTAVERLKKGERDGPLPADIVAKQEAAMGDLDPVVVPPGLEKNAAASSGSD